ncbi:MAG: hypothetical protein NW206_06205 [Hyphomonadaceae bacterium]|nr:hypothetical protein [Hyphomonadaceae bacterium]
MLALFGSTATLVCCALPALFVALGMGAVVAGLVSAVPQITWLSEHKPFVFGASGALIALAAWVQWRNRNAPCPTEPAAARACQRLRMISNVVLAVAALSWCVGAFFAFFAAQLFF